jgi:hypothetical protein
MSTRESQDLRTEMVEARRMLVKNFPQHFAFAAFFYGVSGFALPWRFGASRDTIIVSIKSSLIFGILAGVGLLFVGMLLVSFYASSLTRRLSFGPASSSAMMFGIRLGNAGGLVIFLLFLYLVLLPAITVNPEVAAAVQEWRLYILVIGIIAGWFSGQSIGLLVGLFGAYVCGRLAMKSSL